MFKMKDSFHSTAFQEENEMNNHFFHCLELTFVLVVSDGFLVVAAVEDRVDLVHCGHYGLYDVTHLRFDATH